MFPPTDLFDLIHSLSRTEKRYFKMMAEIHVIGKKNNYLRLFEAILKQEEYDEVAIKKKFRKKTFVKQLTFTKNALSNKILKSLRDYHSGGKDVSVAFQLRESLSNLELLYRKSLLNQMGKELRRSKKIAYQYDAFSYLLQLVEWEKRLLTGTASKKVVQKLAELVAEEAYILLLLQNKTTYQNINEQIVMSLRVKETTKEAATTEDFKQLFDHPLLSDESKALSFTAKLLYHDTKGHYFSKTRQAKQSFEHYQKLVDLWNTQEGKRLQKEDLGAYRKALNNYLNSCKQTNQFDLFPDVLQKMELLPTDTFEAEYKVFQLITINKLLYFINTKRFEEGIAKVKGWENGLEKYGEYISPSHLLTIYYNIALLYFLQENHSEALLWLNEIIYFPKADVRKDLQQVARLLQLILHYELENEDILENLYRSTYRNLKQADDLDSFEQIVLQNVRQLIKVNIFDKSELKKCFLTFRSELQQMVAKTGRFPLGLFEIGNWLDSKIEEKPLRTIL
ncbi:MAG: hypothetical protein R3E32_17025 [Chitinophagales bacterium]